MEKKPVYMIIRFGFSLARQCRNSIVSQRSIQENYGGRFLGIAEQVEVVEGEWPAHLAVVVLSFTSMELAQRWLDSTPSIKQHDWMDGADFIICPVNVYCPPRDETVFSLMDVDIGDPAMFENEYIECVSSKIKEAGAIPCVVNTHCFHKVKGLWDPLHLVIHQWPSRESFESFYSSETYAGQRATLAQCSEANIVVFKLEKDISGSHALNFQ